MINYQQWQNLREQMETLGVTTPGTVGVSGNFNYLEGKKKKKKKMGGDLEGISASSDSEDMDDDDMDDDDDDDDDGNGGGCAGKSDSKEISVGDEEGNGKPMMKPSPEGDMSSISMQKKNMKGGKGKKNMKGKKKNMKSEGSFFTSLNYSTYDPQVQLGSKNYRENFFNSISKDSISL